MGDLWASVVATQPAPPAWVVAAAAACSLLLVLPPAAWRRSRHVVTIAHEGAHALVALLAGRRLTGIRLHSDTSGLTVSRGRPTGVGMVATLAAGYVGPGLLGLGAAAVLATGHAVALVWGLLLLLAFLLLQIRNWFGLWSILVSGAVVTAVTWWVPQRGQSAFAYLVTWFLLFAAPRAVLDLQAARSGRRERHSDADQLARLTGVPGIVWVGLFLVVTAGSLLLGAGLVTGAA